jgi:hypothetical protein
VYGVPPKVPVQELGQPEVPRLCRRLLSGQDAEVQPMMDIFSFDVVHVLVWLILIFCTIMALLTSCWEIKQKSQFAKIGAELEAGRRRSREIRAAINHNASLRFEMDTSKAEKDMLDIREAFDKYLSSNNKPPLVVEPTLTSTRCINCLAELRGGSFCHQCGTRLDQDSADAHYHYSHPDY